MNKLILFTVVTLLLFSNCKSTYEFRSPNDVNRTDCTLYLIDGTLKTGKITIQFEKEANIDHSSGIHLITAEGADEAIPFNIILYYKIKDDLYFPKRFDLSDGIDLPYNSIHNLYLSDQRNYLFVKLVTKPDSKILLFELYLPANNSSDGLEHYKYFVSLPNHDSYEVWYIGGTHFFPNFGEKMSALVSDCTTLAQKIKNKEKGYYFTHSSFEYKWLEVFKRIIEEYNNCK